MSDIARSATLDKSISKHNKEKTETDNYYYPAVDVKCDIMIAFDYRTIYITMFFRCSFVCDDGSPAGVDKLVHACICTKMMGMDAAINATNICIYIHNNI